MDQADQAGAPDQPENQPDRQPQDSAVTNKKTTKAEKNNKKTKQ